MNQVDSAKPTIAKGFTRQDVSRKWTYRHVKRLIDFCLSLFGLILISPLLLIVAIIIKLGSPGGIFYRWVIVDQEGKPFASFKFRTMVGNAEQLEAGLRAAGLNEMKGVYFKLRNDPRVTPIGAFLRKFSLDELPTLISVLTGKMSLVGPRPIRSLEYEKLDDRGRLRLLVKPGITGPWQISGKNEISDFDDIVEIDLEYIENWSLLLDIQILLKTIPCVLAGRNY